MHEREHPWHLRRATARHYRRLRDLADLHELTQAWVAAAVAEGFVAEPAPWTRDADPDQWMLEELAGAQGPDLEPLLDDTLPEDSLERLARVVNRAQATTLKALKGFEDALKLASFRHGGAAGNSRWRALPDEARGDARACLLALEDSPFSGPHPGEGFLIRRATPTSSEVELRACVHGAAAAPSPAHDTLCALHAEWMRGFLHSLNPKLSFSSSREPGKRCVRAWALS